jgi:hypothetical protein
MRASPGIVRIGLAALLVLALGTDLHATVLCATRKGVVVADERCRKHEERIDPRDLGFVGHVGAPGAIGAAGPAGPTVERFFRVVDANGKTACTPLARLGTSVQCVLEPDGGSGLVQLVVGPDGRDPAAPYIYYGAPACEGPPFTADAATVLARGKLVGARLFFATGPRAPFAYRSYEQVSDPCSGGTQTPYGTCCRTVDQPQPSVGAPARSVALSALGLTAPLCAEER